MMGDKTSRGGRREARRGKANAASAFSWSPAGPFKHGRPVYLQGTGDLRPDLLWPAHPTPTTTCDEALPVTPNLS